MFLLAIFALLSGIVTILSPCILPILPIVLSGSLTGNKSRPLGIVAGFIVSFTFFTLLLTSIVKAIGISPDTLRLFSVGIVVVFGLSLLIPQLQRLTEQIFAKLSSFAVSKKQNLQKNNQFNFLTGFLIGISIGIVWTPCVGPILASIIALAATSQVTGQTILIMTMYSIGTGVPLLAITVGGRNILARISILSTHTVTIQKIFGVIMILTALAIYGQWDRKFQTYILEKFPSYGVGLTKFEDIPPVKQALQALKNAPSASVPELMGTAPELVPGGTWFNSPPLSIKNLRGKVILIDFWTYTCINCIRTLPYLKSWYEKYKDMGFVIIGVHTPEFTFEQNPDNVARAISDFGIAYPVMQDNNYVTWNAFSNHYWPGKYLIDQHGVIRLTHFGEGAYDETEQAIQKLLAEGGQKVEIAISNPSYTIHAQTPETYLGYKRLEFFASPEHIANNIPATYSIPALLPENAFAFGGTWTVGEERAMPKKGAFLALNFNAQEVFLVMRPSSGTATIRVTLDGQTVGINAGSDVINNVVTIQEDRLYRIIKLPNPGMHLLKLEFLDGNVELYAFTFG